MDSGELVHEELHSATRIGLTGRMLAAVSHLHSIVDRKSGDRFTFTLWRLRARHLPLLIVWSTWPWICGWMFPGHHDLAWMPVILLAPLIYPGVIAFMAILPGWAAFPVGLAVTLFCVAYLAIVAWRYSTADRVQCGRDSAAQIGVLNR
jgi:hypothetical protein